MGRGDRTRSCDARQAKQRLARAQEFLEVAELVVDEKDADASPVYASSAAALAVLAGIAPEVRKVMRRAGKLVGFASEALAR